VKIAGCDPGQSGAVALLDTGSGSLVVHNMPLVDDRSLDSQALFQVLLDFAPDALVEEDLWRPKSLVRMTGELACLGKLLGSEVVIVRPQLWKKVVLGHSTSDKKQSITKALELYPGVDLKRTARCSTLSDDRAEAVLLAHYWAVTTRVIKQ